MTDSSKRLEAVPHFTSGTIERNRILSWDIVNQRPNKSSPENLSSKITLSPSPLWLAARVPKLTIASLARLLYITIKLGYEIAKYLTRGLSGIRSYLFVAK